jgi:putative lipoic acid-binding regulatory protein
MMTNKNIEEIVKTQDNQPDGLTFPCDYPIKAMGPNTEKFKQEMLFIAQKYCSRAEEKHLRSNLSKTGKYQSVTIIIVAKSREHLQEIYAELKSHNDVKWTL